MAIQEIRGAVTSLLWPRSRGNIESNRQSVSHIVSQDCHGSLVRIHSRKLFHIADFWACHSCHAPQRQTSRAFDSLICGQINDAQSKDHSACPLSHQAFIRQENQHKCCDKATKTRNNAWGTAGIFVSSTAATTADCLRRRTRWWAYLQDSAKCRWDTIHHPHPLCHVQKSANLVQTRIPHRCKEPNR